MSNYKLYSLNKFGDSRGSLVVFEKGNNINFELKRAFYIYGSDSKTVRGKHANKQSQFLMVCLSGKCKIWLDDGKQQEIFELNKPDYALWLNKMVWKEMYDFSPECVLLVLSDQKYLENEYIRNYDEFKEIIKTIKND